MLGGDDWRRLRPSSCRATLRSQTEGSLPKYLSRAGFLALPDFCHLLARPGTNLEVGLHAQPVPFRCDKKSMMVGQIKHARANLTPVRRLQVHPGADVEGNALQGLHRSATARRWGNLLLDAHVCRIG